MIRIKDIIPPIIIKIYHKLNVMFLLKRSQKKFYNRLENIFADIPEINKIFPYTKVEKHFQYETMRQTVQHPDIYINQIRFYRLYQFFKKHYPDVFYGNSSIIDIGDTSGLLLKALNRDKLSVNINRDIVAHINTNGVEASWGGC